ncbi:MAG: hypothetical protein C9356_17295 [Oleiphilus sp.]|nr:MAG: hypothetical protein C9356_17295 [Oleiphilus sp.]
MTLFLRRLCVLSIISLLSVSAAHSRQLDLAEQYFEKSGMGLMLDALSDSIASRLNLKRLAESNIALHAKAGDLVHEAVVEMDGRRLALDYLRSEVDQVKLAETYAFLSSPLGEKITRAEAEASSPEAQLAMQEFRLALASNPAPAEREQLIRSLVKEAHMVESMMQLLERLYLMVSEIAEKTADAERALPFGEMLGKEWRELKPALRMQFEQLVMLSAHFSYRALSDDEIRQYVDFLSEPRGRVYWESSMHVVDRYLNLFLMDYTVLLNKAARHAS